MRPMSELVIAQRELFNGSSQPNTRVMYLVSDSDNDRLESEEG